MVTPRHDRTATARLAGRRNSRYRLANTNVSIAIFGEVEAKISRRLVDAKHYRQYSLGSRRPLFCEDNDALLLHCGVRREDLA